MRATALCLFLLPQALGAHPHIFVEAEVGVVVDDAGAITGVRLTWRYDDFFSLLLTSDLGIDLDGDLRLTPEEAEILRGAVTDWPPDFGGDLDVRAGGVPVALAGRIEASAEMIEGRVVEAHVRQLRAPVAAGEIVTIQVYDPFYYVAYTIVGDIAIEGAATCSVSFQPADLNAAYSLVDELLYGRPASDVGPDEEFPEVGQAFADTVTVTCSA